MLDQSGLLVLIAAQPLQHFQRQTLLAERGIDLVQRAIDHVLVLVLDVNIEAAGLGQMGEGKPAESRRVLYPDVGAARPPTLSKQVASISLHCLLSRFSAPDGRCTVVPLRKVCSLACLGPPRLDFFGLLVARTPAKSGLLARKRQISFCIRLRGGAGRTRTSNQTIISSWLAKCPKWRGCVYSAWSLQKAD